MSASPGGLLLVIDVGNTNTVIGLYDGDELIDHWRIGTNRLATTDELGVLYLSLLSARGIDPATISAAVCASVVPPMVHATRRACQRYFNVEPLFVGPDLDTGMPIHIDNPLEVGADRIVNAVAAWSRYRCACIVVDLGTATTFDVVSAAGAYEGGVIAPGLRISLDALFQHAAKLPRVEIVKPASAVGKGTVASMQSGIFYGYIGLVDGVVDRILADWPERPMKVVATGGLANLIAPESRHIEVVESFLTLDGLRLIYRRHLEAQPA